MKKTIWLLFLLCFIPVSSWAIPVTVPVTVSFDPQDSIVFVGDFFTVDLVADIPDPVLGWGLDVTFDTSVLDLSGVTVGSAWFPTSGFDGDALAAIAFPTPVSGDDILLATLTFDAIALGTSDLTASITLGDLTEGFPLAPPAPPGSFADVVFEPASVNVVPEPATVLLFSTGLIGLAGLRRKSRKR